MSSKFPSPALLLLLGVTTIIGFVSINPENFKPIEVVKQNRKESEIPQAPKEIAENENTASSGKQTEKNPCPDTSKLKANDEKLQNLMKIQSYERQLVLQEYLVPNTQKKEWGPFYNAIVAEIVCPWLARVGNVNDGGKWTCNPWALGDNCVIYSLGVGPDITFELEMAQMVEGRCKIYSFDPDPKLGQQLVDMNNERFVFQSFKIAQWTVEKDQQYSVKDIMKKQNHTFIDFFKIDIEGSEFAILPSLLRDKNAPVACQIFIEMHGSPAQCARLHSTLARAGFYMFFYEINGFHHQLSEYSFMHESCFEKFGVTDVFPRNFPE